MAKDASSTRRESPPDPAIAALQPPVEDEAPPYEESDEEEEEVAEEEEEKSLPLDEEGYDSDLGWLKQVGPPGDCEDTLEDHPTRPTSDEEEEEEEERVAEEAAPENPDDDDSDLDVPFQEEEKEAGPQHASSATRRIFVKSKLPLRLRRKQAVDRRADFPPKRGKKVTIGPNDARITAALTKTKEEQRRQRWEQYDLHKRGGGRGGGGGGKKGRSNRNR